LLSVLMEKLLAWFSGSNRLLARAQLAQAAMKLGAGQMAGRGACW